MSKFDYDREPVEPADGDEGRAPAPQQRSGFVWRSVPVLAPLAALLLLGLATLAYYQGESFSLFDFILGGTILLIVVVPLLTRSKR